MRIFYLLFILLFCKLLNAQVQDYSDLNIPKSQSKLYKKGMQAMNVKDYFLAKLYFDKLKEKGYQNNQQLFQHSILLYKLGEYDRFSNNIDSLELMKFKHKLLPYYKVQSLLKESNHSEARDYALFFLKQKGVRTEYKPFYSHIMRVKRTLDSMENSFPVKDYYVHKIEGNINGSAAEFNPVINKTGIYYGSQSLSDINYYSNKKFRKSEHPSTRSIKTAVGKKGVFNTIVDFPIEIKNMELSSFCFDLKGRVMYLTGCKYCEDSGKYFCQIYKSKKEDNKWTEPLIVEELKADGFNTTHVNMGYDDVRKADVLFFSSNRKGTKGGMDIWMSIQNPRTLKFYKPRNLGRAINTSKNEITPLFHYATGRLYFSSDGRGGLGGHDVYYSKYEKGMFSLVNTVGKEINSPQDDVFFHPNRTLTRGYFVSNRYSDNSLLNPHCCDDIFYFDKIKRPSINSDTFKNNDNKFSLLKMKVKDSNTGNTIVGYRYKIFQIDSSLNSKILYKGMEPDSIWSNIIDTKFEYRLEVEKEGYTQEIKYLSGIEEDEFEVTLKLEKGIQNKRGLSNFKLGVIDNKTREILSGFSYRVYQIDSSLNSTVIHEGMESDSIWSNTLDKRYEYRIEVEKEGYDKGVKYLSSIEDSLNTYINLNTNNSQSNGEKDKLKIRLNVIDKETKKPISNFVYQIDKIDSLYNTYILDYGIGESKMSIEEIEKGFDYQTEIYAKGYYRKKAYVTVTKDSTYLLTIELEKINYNPIVLPLVEFEFDSFTLTSRSMRIIDSLVIPVLVNNPTLMIELSAHTDSRGTDEYNLSLSEKRAYAIYFYLINHHNIDRRRLKHKGYGEYAPVALNENSDGTDNPEGRQRNRRCEFRILKTEFDPY